MLRIIVMETEAVGKRMIVMELGGEFEQVAVRIKDAILKEDDKVDFPEAKNTHKNRYIAESLQYIDRNYGEKDICVRKIAESIGISEGHLSHLFKKEMESSVMAYLTRYRMRIAMGMLRDCGIKVYEVADRVGYRDMTSFSDTFKRVVGMNPSEYQKHCL